MELLRGIGRKLAIPVLVVSILGWVLYVVGFAAFNETNDNYYNELRTQGLNYSNATGYTVTVDADPTLPERRADIDFFPLWCFLIVAPFLYINNFIHLIVGRWFTGLSNHFLTTLYLAVGGAVLYRLALDLFGSNSIGVEYGLSDDWVTDTYWGLWPLLQWVGCLFSVFFMALYMMMWVCFKTKPKVEYYDEEEEEYEEEEEGEGDKEETAEQPAEQPTEQPVEQAEF